MMTDYYAALKAKWETLVGTTDEKLSDINSEIVAGPKQAVNVAEVTGYLATNLKLASLMEYSDTPPNGALPESVAAAQNLVALFRLPQPPAFRTDLPNIYQVIESALTALADDALSGISQADVDNLLALADTSVHWWAANGYPEPINNTNLSQAGLI